MTKPHTAKGMQQSTKILIIIASVLVLIGAAITGLYFYNLQRYNAAFAEVNTDTVESLIVASEESKEFKKLTNLLRDVNEAGIVDSANLKEAGRLSSQIADRFDKLCDAYSDNFVLSTELPTSFINTVTLTKEQKDNLNALAKSLKTQEDKYCAEAKAAAGVVLLTHDATVANTNWYNTYSSTYTDTVAIEGLKKYYDGSYEVKYEADMINLYGDSFKEQINLFKDVYANAYDYSIETDESQYDAKWSKVLAAQDAYNANPMSSGLEATHKKQAKKSLEDTLAFYELVSAVSEKDQKQLKYSTSASTATLLSSAISMHSADLDTKPIANSTTELIEILKEKRYLDPNLDISSENITYVSSDGQDATMTVKIEATNKSYEIFL